MATVKVVTGVTFPPLFIYGKTQDPVAQPAYGNDMRAIEQWEHGIKVTTQTITTGGGGGGNIPSQYCLGTGLTTAPLHVSSYTYVAQWNSITNVGGTGPRFKTTRKIVFAQKTGLYLIALTLAYDLRSGVTTPHTQPCTFETNAQPSRHTGGSTNYSWTFTGRTHTGSSQIYRTIGPTYTWFAQLTATQTFDIQTQGRMAAASLGTLAILTGSLFVRRIT